MYKLLRALFGWDYISWKNTADCGISRVYLSGNDMAFYWRYKSLHFAIIINEPEDVLWLTCKPEKYLHKVQNESNAEVYAGDEVLNEQLEHHRVIWLKDGKRYISWLTNAEIAEIVSRRNSNGSKNM